MAAMGLVNNTDQRRTIAYRVVTDRLVLRCWNPADAPQLRAALDACDAHLRPWIPFMKDEPRSLEQTAEWLRGIRASFDTDKMYRYAVFDSDENTLLGENMLIKRVGPGGLEIGYWTHKDAVGRGIASEASCAMIRVAFEIEKVDRVEIMCAPENTASSSIPASLGFSHEATLKQRALNSEGRYCDLMVWSLFKTDYASSPAAKLNLSAHDCLGKAIRLN